MSHDTELFELCKEVYKRTGWIGTINLINDEVGATFMGPIGANTVPLYTSDYLLEELPWGYGVRKYPEYYLAFSWDNDNRYVESETPLKALLKLTIALHDAGELTHA
ncbi:hypothetical protein [Pseudarthrobacter sp. ATCC 49987]|uniref:hypothetical protein n=1 Tax=Pseudarthrobacter sp. ATCC 49987 TaxID=2698204 RepID=UPI001369C926|nr:hypothetical protein [Pseudarthrobacter sp. ATCC 49987]